MKYEMNLEDVVNAVSPATLDLFLADLRGWLETYFLTADTPGVKMSPMFYWNDAEPAGLNSVRINVENP